MTPSLEGWPTKAKEAPSPHEVRLAPLDTNPVVQSLGLSYPLSLKRKHEAILRTSVASNTDFSGSSNVGRGPPTSWINDYVASSDDVNLRVLNLGLNLVLKLVLATKIIPLECHLSNLPAMETQKDFVELEIELTDFAVINRREPISINGSEQLSPTSPASSIPTELSL